jgi:mannose-6-phosphate isomerase-like protein (cupin superfamily)
MPVYQRNTLKNRESWVAFDDFETYTLDPRGDAAPIELEIRPNGSRQLLMCLGGTVIVSSRLGRQKLDRTCWLDIPEGGVEVTTTGATAPGDQAELLRISGQWEDTPHVGVFWAWPETPLEVHYHDFDEYWFIVSGHSTGCTDGDECQLKAGDLVATCVGYEHGMPNPGEKVTGVAFEPQLHAGQRKGHLHRHEHGDPVPSRPKTW